MKKTIRSTVIAAVLLLAPITSLYAVESPEPEIPRDYHLVFRLSNDFAPVTVVCNAVLDPARAEKLAKDVWNAYQFVCETQKWPSRELLKPALQVRVNAKMDKGLLGYAEKNVFTIGLSYIDMPLAQGTLAHELTHCQDRRQLLGHRLPNYMAEGRALLDGRAYREKLGQRPSGYDRGVRDAILKFTVQDAEEVLSGAPVKAAPLTGAKLVRMEFLGCFFVDFLRAKCDAPDIQPRTARLVMDLGRGMTYEDAFRKEIGISFEEAKGKFIAYLKDNSGSERLRGTLWQDL
jgi:hypothetical protein